MLNSGTFAYAAVTDQDFDKAEQDLFAGFAAFPMLGAGYQLATGKPFRAFNKLNRTAKTDRAASPTQVDNWADDMPDVPIESKKKNEQASLTGETELTNGGNRTDNGPVGEGGESAGKADFYIKPDGDILPSTFYRYAHSKYAPISDAKSGVLPEKRGGTYVSFDKLDDAIVASDKLQIPYRPDYRVSGDTLDVIDDIKIPKGDWGKADYLEPVTKDFKKFGPGNATQAVIDGDVPVDPTTIEKLP